MFDLLTNLTKAAVGVVIETPISLAADIVTLGGSLTNKEDTYTGNTLNKVMDNLNQSTK